MRNGKIRSIRPRCCHVRMNDGKLFVLLYSTRTNAWEVYAGMDSAPDQHVGSHPSLAAAKTAIETDYALRDYPEHKQVWYGTKWGLYYDQKRRVRIWRDTPPAGWTFNFLDKDADTFGEPQSK